MACGAAKTVVQGVPGPNRVCFTHPIGQLKLRCIFVQYFILSDIVFFEACLVYSKCVSISGTYKYRSEGPVKRGPHELDKDGLVPLPAKLCHMCHKYLSYSLWHKLCPFVFDVYLVTLLSVFRTCRRAVLIQCDYCPLLFHMDCLDPPMTSTPTNVWMCPNHAQNHVVSDVHYQCNFTENYGASYIFLISDCRLLSSLPVLIFWFILFVVLVYIFLL